MQVGVLLMVYMFSLGWSVCHPLRKITAFSKRPAWYNDISGWDTNARSTCIGIGIGHCIHSNTRIGSYQCMPVSSVL